MPSDGLSSIHVPSQGVSSDGRTVYDNKTEKYIPVISQESESKESKEENTIENYIPTMPIPPMPPIPPENENSQVANDSISIPSIVASIPRGSETGSSEVINNIRSSEISTKPSIQTDSSIDTDTKYVSGSDTNSTTNNITKDIQSTTQSSRVSTDPSMGHSSNIVSSDTSIQSGSGKNPILSTSSVIANDNTMTIRMNNSDSTNNKQSNSQIKDKVDCSIQVESL